MTNTFVRILAAAGIACLVGGTLTMCVPKPSSTASSAASVEEGSSSSSSSEGSIGPAYYVASHQVAVFTDENGCQYLTWDSGDYAGGITPRMEKGKNGRRQQICDTPQVENEK